MSEYTQDQFFTPDQIKAIKKVEAAMKAAGKLGLNFWDDYGTLSAYSKDNITHPDMDNFGNNSKIEIERGIMSYCLSADNFSAGNADDPLYSKIKKLNNEK